MEECVDGEYQNFKANGGGYTREHFFGKFPETAAMVANMSDDEIWRLNRGGHDPRKVYAAYDNAVNHKGQPTIILAKTVKGYGMGAAGEGQNIAHQQKKLGRGALKEFRDRFNIPVSDKDIEKVPYCMPEPHSSRDRVPARATPRAGRFSCRVAAARHRRCRCHRWKHSKPSLTAPASGKHRRRWRWSAS